MKAHESKREVPVGRFDGRFFLDGIDFEFKHLGQGCVYLIGVNHAGDAFVMSACKIIGGRFRLTRLAGRQIAF